LILKDNNSSQKLRTVLQLITGMSRTDTDRRVRQTHKRLRVRRRLSILMPEAAQWQG